MYNTVADATTSPNLEHALTYAAANFYVFPARASGEKRSYKSKEYCPEGRNWGATKNPDTLRGYWAEHPDANIGLPTGADNGVFVFEFDTPEGHQIDGASSLAELEAKYGKLPPTSQSQSPTGSIHFYFRHPGFYVKCSNSEIAPGIDIKGDGGMVLVPPSNRPGKGAYQWLNDLPVADAPQWLLDLIKVTATKSASTAIRPAVPIPPPPTGATPAEKAVHEAYFSVAQMPKGGRNQKLNDSSFKLGIWVGRGEIDEENAVQILLAACEVNGSLAENARECHGTIDSGMSAGRREGRKVMDAFHDTVVRQTSVSASAPPPPEGYTPPSAPHGYQSSRHGAATRCRKPVAYNE
jgi:hypothetical protein